MRLFPDDMINLSAATADRVELPVLHQHKVDLHVLRLDKIHGVISGNKWFKLKYHIHEALRGGCQGILTAGGAYSNHIVAAACVARNAGLNSTGIIRGEAPVHLSHTLQEAQQYGMKLEFVSREIFKEKNYERLSDSNPGYYFIPEGGAGANGVRGCLEILDLVPKQHYSTILCAVGTATMYAGLANSSLPGQQLIGIPVLKGMNNLQEQISGLLQDAGKKNDGTFFHDYHFGGYAKRNDELYGFMNSFYEQTKIPTDFVYTAKLMFAALDLVAKNHFAPGSNLLVIHSGGLQGNLSLPEHALIF